MRKIFFGAVIAVAAIAPKMALAQLIFPDDTELPEASILDIATGLMQWLLIIVAVIAVIAFVVSGILYLVSAGDDNRAETAKKAMINAIIGVIVALSGLVILYAVDSWLGGGSEF